MRRVKQHLSRAVIKAFGQLLVRASRRFQTALQQPQQAQKTVQERLIKQLKSCDYGKRYGIDSAMDWHRLPIVNYDQISPWIAQATKTTHPLTPEPILFYEPTSGSRGAVKQIPYTRQLRRSFNHLFCIWAYDLIAHGPKFCTGKFYFSISPRFTDVPAAGTTDDADYLDPWLRWLLKPFLVVAPPAKTPSEFKENLAKTLLKAEDLEIVSVWSPSFLMVQLDYIQQNKSALSQVLSGEISAQRLSLLAQVEIPWSQLWPKLKLISCWDSVTAADSADKLQQFFPRALVQGKGLLATEAPMTVPIVAASVINKQGKVPLLDEVFFEFEDDGEQVYELHELAVGETYEIIVSQMGGLYRYRMGDRVQVTHFFKQTPCLKFVGRGKETSDLVGEKLNADFVRDVLSQLNLDEATFQSLVPITDKTPFYVLLIDRTTCKQETVAEELEEALQQSFHYQLARQLDQLAPARVVISIDIAEQFARVKAQSGQRWGDVKHARLESAIAPSALERIILKRTIDQKGIELWRHIY